MVLLSNMPKRSSSRKTRDVNQSAARVVAAATGRPTPKRKKNPAAVALGRLGGLKGGKARADSLTPKQRSEIARKAAASRWENREDE
jgi:hypothetical protein